MHQACLLSLVGGSSGLPEGKNIFLSFQSQTVCAPCITYLLIINSVKETPLALRKQNPD